MLITKSNIDALAKDILAAHLTGNGLSPNIINRLSPDVYLLRTIEDAVIKHTLYIGKHAVMVIDLDDFRVGGPILTAAPKYTSALVSKKIEAAVLTLVGYEINLEVERVIHKLGSSTDSDMYFGDIQINISDVEIDTIRKESFINIIYNTQLWYSAPFRSCNDPALKTTLTSIFKRKVLDGSFVLHL